MTLKQLQRKIDELIRNDVYRGDAIVIFSTGRNGQELTVQRIEMAKHAASGLIAAKLS